MPADPTAAFDQMDATLRLQANLIAAYYQRLRAAKVPPRLAAKLTEQIQDRLVAAMLGGTT